MSFSARTLNTGKRQTRPSASPSRRELELSLLYSEELSITLAGHSDADCFHWFLASLLFGAQISEKTAKNTYLAFVRHGLTNPTKIVDSGWNFLVNPIMREGGYVRYDGRKSTQILRDCETLLADYHGSLNLLHEAARDPRDLEEARWREGNRVMQPPRSFSPLARWEHFPHDADVGLRGFGATPEEAFEQAACALTAVVTSMEIGAKVAVEVHCEAPDLELLFVEWLNSIIYEMATRRLLFGGFAARIEGCRLRGTLWGEPIDSARHAPASEPKGATYTALNVSKDDAGVWSAACVVDV